MKRRLRQGAGAVRAPRLLGDGAACGAVDALHRRRQSNALRRLTRQGGPRGLDGRRHRAEGRHPHRQLQRRQHRRSRGEGNVGRQLQHLLHANRRDIHAGRQHREAEAPLGCLRRHDRHRLDRTGRTTSRSKASSCATRRARRRPRRSSCGSTRRSSRGRPTCTRWTGRVLRPTAGRMATTRRCTSWGTAYDLAQIFTYAGSGYDSFFGIVSDQPFDKISFTAGGDGDRWRLDNVSIAR